MVAPTGSTSSFSNAGPYTVTIGNDGSQTSQVITSYNTIQGYSTYWIFISEDTPDGGDCDFNDSTVLLSWSLNIAG
jgi:Fucose-binding lectin II (PA-IIL)